VDELFPFIVARYNYWAALILLLIGLYGMVAKNNLMKKIIGMTIFQTAIILFYISLGVKKGASIPILWEGHGVAGSATPVIEAAAYANPLPHVLMLTAIVVGVGILGVALAILQKIQQVHGTIEEDEVLQDLRDQAE
jgi:multicomponent Na+:H+ antiporter subunit C